MPPGLRSAIRPALRSVLERLYAELTNTDDARNVAISRVCCGVRRTRPTSDVTLP